MGLLNTFSKESKPELKRLPAGTFTIDAEGWVIGSTLPSSVPEAQTREIGQNVLAIFKGARNANLQFSELVVQYAAFKITAREMRGGAIIFLSPTSPQSASRP